MELRRSKRLKLSASAPAAESFQVQAFSCPEILENVVSCLKPQDQKSCRLVCKTWNQEVTRLFRKTLAAAPLNGFISVIGAARADLREAMRTGKELQLPSPFKKLKLQLFPERTRGFPETLKSLGLTVTHIEIRLPQIPLTDIWQHANDTFTLVKVCAPLLTSLIVPSLGISSEILSTPLELPELKVLKLCFRGYVDASEREMSDDINNQGYFFAKLLASAPKLKELEINSKGVISVFEFPLPATYICKFLSVADLSNIQVLSVWVPLGWQFQNIEDYATILTSLKSVKINQLKRLRVSSSVLHTEFDLYFFVEVISHFSESLQEFCTDFWIWMLESPFVIPPCPKLTTLNLSYVFPFSHLDLSNLPNLKTIKLAGSLCETRRQSIVPVLSVDTVHLSLADRIEGQERVSFRDLIKIVFHWFPNVKNWKVSHKGLHSALTDHIKRHKLLNQVVVLLKVRKLIPTRRR